MGQIIKLYLTACRLNIRPSIQIRFQAYSKPHSSKAGKTLLRANHDIQKFKFNYKGRYPNSHTHHISRLKIAMATLLSKPKLQQPYQVYPRQLSITLDMSEAAAEKLQSLHS